MTKQYSIAEARSRLPGIVHDVESGPPVELTRRGRPVAVVMSLVEYRRLTAEKKGGVWERIEDFRRRMDIENLDIPPETWEGLRDRSPGRAVEL